jgi:hypothetical protein
MTGQCAMHWHKYFHSGLRCLALVAFLSSFGLPAKNVGRANIRLSVFSAQRHCEAR